MKPPDPLEVKIDVGETTFKVVEPAGETKVGVEDPAVLVGIGRGVAVEGIAVLVENDPPPVAVEVVGDEEMTAGKTDDGDEDTVAQRAPVTVIVVMTVTVGSPLVPIAVWIGGGLAKVSVDPVVVEAGGEGVAKEGVKVVVAGSGVEDKEGVSGEGETVLDSTVNVLAGTVTKVMLLN